MQQLLGQGGIHAGDSGAQHDVGSGIQIDLAGLGQQGHVRAQLREGVAAQAQPGQLVHGLRYQRPLQGRAHRRIGRLLRAQEAVQEQGQFLRGQVQDDEQAGDLRCGGGMHLVADDEVAQVQTRLQVKHLARQQRATGLVGQDGVTAVRRQKGGKPCRFQRHGPGLGQIIGTAFAPVFGQYQARPVVRALQYPGRLCAAALRAFDLHRAPLLP